MESVIITLWVLGAWAEAMSIAVNQSELDYQDSFMILIWPATTVLLVFILLLDKANFRIKFNNPWL